MFQKNPVNKNTEHTPKLSTRQMNNVLNRLLQQLKKREELGNLRSLKLTKNLVDFSSNDYLGMARNQQLISHIKQTVNSLELSNGSTGSRLLTGNSSLQMDLERRLAAFFHAPAALLFNSGYTANLALISTLPQRGDTVLYDQAIHACVKDGARLSNAKCLSFRHNDLTDLARKLARSTGEKFVVIESLYSMDGDYSPVPEMIEICQRNHAAIIMDEAHTTGWAGPEGRGWGIRHQLEKDLLARVHTFGKGMGVHGACVVGSVELINYMVNFARPFIYTTALPPHSIVSIDCVLTFLEQSLVTSVWLSQRIEYYLKQASKLTIEKSINAGSPIQWILTRGNRRTVNISKGLQAKGFDVRPILSPTVPEGRERLRICIHSFNTEAEVNNLIEAISSQS